MWYDKRYCRDKPALSNADIVVFNAKNTATDLFKLELTLKRICAI